MSSRSDFTERVGKNIRRLRLAKGLTQWELGQMVGYSEFTVCRNEKGDGLSADSLDVYARGMGCSLGELIAEDGPDPITEFENTVDSVRMLPKDIISNVTTMMKSAIAIYRVN